MGNHGVGFAVGLGVVVFAALAACVGDDPSFTGGGDAGNDATAASDAPGSDTSTGSDGATDAGTDGPLPPRCDPKKPFGAPTLLSGAINTPQHEGAFTMTSDELVAVITRRNAPGSDEIRYATRASRDVPFPAADFDKVSNVNSGADPEYTPSLGADGLTLYFHRTVVASSSELLRFATRGSRTDSFAADDVVVVDGVALPHGVAPKISRDGLRLYYTDIDGDNVFMAKRSTSVGAFTSPKSMKTSGSNPVLSKDELTLYYIDVAAPGGPLRVATRGNVDAVFGAGQDLPPTVQDQSFATHITDDDCILYLVSARVTAGAPGGLDIYEARRGL